jgi:hypothetical protein
MMRKLTEAALRNPPKKPRELLADGSGLQAQHGTRVGWTLFFRDFREDAPGPPPCASKTRPILRLESASAAPPERPVPGRRPSAPRAACPTTPAVPAPGMPNAPPMRQARTASPRAPAERKRRPRPRARGARVRGGDLPGFARRPLSPGLAPKAHRLKRAFESRAPTRLFTASPHLHKEEWTSLSGEAY